MSTIEYYRCLIFILFSSSPIRMISSSNEDNYRLEILHRSEGESVRFVCDLIDVAWWKRPDLLATRSGIILGKFRPRFIFEQNRDDRQSPVLAIHELHSNDSGIYECETLGAIRLFNLTVTVRLGTVELGAQFVASDEPTRQVSSLPISNGHIHLREHQLVRLTCVVSRALPAASLQLPLANDYRIERNSTSENDDHTFRTVLVLIVRVSRHDHQRLVQCQATQSKSGSREQYHVLSNTLLMDVAYGPTCSQTIQFPSQIFAGIHRPINLTCHMNNGNPASINFTWHLPDGHIRLGERINGTSSSITLIPRTANDFGRITCRATNALGLAGECDVNMTLGGIPDPIETCRYTYVNATLTVNCMVGFHQGDEDFFCYMYKRQENHSYSEHARLKGNCAFILPDLKPDDHHDFRVFTKNRYGDNFDRSYSIKVGRARIESLAEKTRMYWPYMAVFVIGACLASLFLACCSCQQARKAMFGKKKPKGNFESLTYQNPNSHPRYAKSDGQEQPAVHMKQNGHGSVYPVRPYRSKDRSVSSEPSTLHRPHSSSAFKTTYSTNDETSSHRRSLAKETDLDHSATNAPVKALPSHRQHVPINSDGSSPIPGALQRRSSFQAATKLNSLDFFTDKEPLFFLDKQLRKPTARNHYLSDREHYRDKRRTYSPYGNVVPYAKNSLIVENPFSTGATGYFTRNDPPWRETNPLNDFDRDNYLFNHHDRDQSTFGNYDRDRGIFV